MERKRNPKAIIGLIVGGCALGIFILAVVIVVFLAINGDKSKSTGGSSGAGILGGQATIDAGNGNQILNDFRDNPIAAEKKWIGKRVRIKQLAGNTSKDPKGRYYLWLRCGIAVYPSKAELDKFGTVQDFQTVTIETTLTKFTTGSWMPDDSPVVFGDDSTLIAN